jgi:hypothetical protein
LPEIKSSKVQNKDILDVDPDNVECINQLDMMEKTIENNNKSMAPINRSSLDIAEQKSQLITEFDLM